MLYPSEETCTIQINSQKAAYDVKGRPFWKGRAYNEAQNNTVYIVYVQPNLSLRHGDVIIATRMYTRNNPRNNLNVVFVYEYKPSTTDAIDKPCLSEPKNFVCDLRDCYFDNAYLKGIFHDENNPNVQKKLVIIKRHMPNFPFAKILNKIKKAFNGQIVAKVEEETYSSAPYVQRYNRITEAHINDEVLQHVKKIHATYVINIELLRLIRQARRTKQFLQKSALANKLNHLSADRDLIDRLIEERFVRDKYDYRCFEILKSITKNENVFMTDTQLVFQLQDELGGPTWYIVETPGVAAATYIFGDKLPLEELLATLSTVNKACIIADSEVQRYMGFKCRIIHRTFDGWLAQLREIVKEHSIAQFLADDVVTKVLEEAKIRASRQIALQKTSTEDVKTFEDETNNK